MTNRWYKNRYSHARNGSLGAGCCREAWERGGGALNNTTLACYYVREDTKEYITYRLLNVRDGLAGGEHRCTEGLGLGGGNDVRAVNQIIHVLAKRRDRREDELEVLLELRLVVWYAVRQRAVRKFRRWEVTY